MISEKRKRLTQRIEYILMVTALLITFYGWYIKGFNVIFCGIMFLYMHNIVYAWLNIKERVLFFVFHLTFFLFLLTGPLIGMLKGEEWWHRALQDNENVYFALLLVILSLVFMFVGATSAEQLRKIKNKRYVKSDKNPAKDMADNSYYKYLQIVSMLVFYITAVFFFIQETEKLLFMNGRTYLQYYSEFSSKLPGFFHTIAAFMTYSLCIFLATFPNKRKSFIALALYEISAIPSLIIGMRNPIILHSIFILLYYIIRDIKKDKEKWIGRFEKVILGLVTPAMFCMMIISANIRNGESLKGTGILKTCVEFLEGQGITFQVLAIGYGWRNGLPQRAGRNYTFGGFIDYCLHGTIGQKIFGTQPLPDGNSIVNGVESNSFAHNLSYVTLKERYLDGAGWGSSYLIENYLDFGFIGVIIFNLILGFLLLYALHWLKSRVLINTIILISLTNIFFIPRAEATGWLTFVITVQFWCCIGCCYLGAFFCAKSKWMQNILRKLHLYS